MKKLIIILLLLISGVGISQTYKDNRDRVWQTLTNLPINDSNGRLSDLKENYWNKWKSNIYSTVIYYYIDTVGDVALYTRPQIDIVLINGSYTEVETSLPRVGIDTNMLTRFDNREQVVEHELYHSAFRAMDYMPGWMIYLGSVSNIYKCCQHIERIAQALVTRRDILDYLKLPLNTFLSSEQIEKYYLEKRSTGLHHGAANLLISTTPVNLVKLLNFVNGYEL